VGYRAPRDHSLPYWHHFRTSVTSRIDASIRQHYANSMRVSVEYAQEHFIELLDAVDRGLDVLIEASNGELYRLELAERPTSE
jgi:hypothetical protein